MQEDRLTWLLRKGMIALPVILVLALARCGGDTAGNGEDTSADGTNEPTSSQKATKPEQTQTEERTGERKPDEFTAGEIKAAMREHIENRTRMGNPGYSKSRTREPARPWSCGSRRSTTPCAPWAMATTSRAPTSRLLATPTRPMTWISGYRCMTASWSCTRKTYTNSPVHKHGEWVQQPRYNFVDDRINLLR